jgi:hypothetical protein
LLIAPMIISCSLGIGIVDNGIIDLRKLIGTAAANGVAATAPSGVRDSTIGTLSDGAHSFTVTETDDAGTSPASPALNVTVAPEITSFSGANGSTVMIAGTTAQVQNASQSWSLTMPEADTLRFELRPGDHWRTFGWSDLLDNDGAERTEIAFAPQYAEGIEINLSYKFMIESKAENTSSWLLLGQFHQRPANRPPPFAVEMSGDHMVIAIRYESPGQTAPTYQGVYHDPIPIQRGQNYFMNIQVNFDNTGNGYLNVWRDGVQIVSYHGPIGYGSGQTYYWKEGIYRAATTEMMAVRYQGTVLRPLLPEPHQ